ncbi:YceD family protein [Rhodocyclus tenuis]|uniref:Large ribosomal RNA subunit accumulation protein YceD n=1 Tax=Rhodocyclus tenuis TaxID=1066 RepID=A0A840FYG2_RHOTE|nr:DUF177 domain-containing protein [Rhodocyclus tenuis]MBB4247157.1 uncharacterized protein [Rhodocyclus tenuis]
MSQQIVIDSLAFVQEAGSLQGELRIAQLSRTHDWLAQTSGAVAYRVSAVSGERGQSQLKIEVDGVLQLRCQRCLEAMEYSLQLNSRIELVSSEAEITQEELEDDSRDYLPAQQELDVVALIEDEIILALPFAPRHESCSVPLAGPRTSKVLPFAALAALKGKPA